MDPTTDDEVLERAMTQLATEDVGALEPNATIRARSELETTSAPALPSITVDPPSSERPTDSARSARSDYTLLTQLGEGGMGRVLLAIQRSLDREVAIKTLKSDASPAAQGALLREARLIGMLEHPGVIPVHALGVGDDGVPLLVMKRVSGVDVATLLTDTSHAAWGDFSPDRTIASLEILMQVCQTVEFAHRRGIVHRDIKPENIMVGELGEVYLVDWGVATSMAERTASTALVGTPSYMAPEMARGQTVDERTDVYLLGATLHQILTGKAPHDRGNFRDVVRSVLDSSPRTYEEEVPSELASLCNRAMSRDPARRPPSALAFRSELADFLRHRGARAISDAATERLDELSTLLDAAGSRPPSDIAAAYRLANEARFGFAQALREHPESVPARLGMRRTIDRLIEIELRQEHPAVAAALLRELDDPPRELALRIEELTRRVAERARAEERLASMHLDLAPSVNARQRVYVFAGFGVFVAAATLALIFRRSAVSRTELVWTAFGALVIVGVAHALLRGKVASNAFNRRGIALLYLSIVASIVNRSMGVLRNTPAETTIAFDLVIASMAYAFAAIALRRDVWICVSILMAGLVGVLCWPARAFPVYNLTTLAGVIVFTMVLARRKPPPT